LDLPTGVISHSGMVTTQEFDSVLALAERKVEHGKLLNHFADVAHGRFALSNEVQTAGQQLHGGLLQASMV
jgi:hypothetical protein